VSKLKPNPKKPNAPTIPNAIRVMVKLNAADHEAASLAATLSHETLSEWIGSLVNTALMP